MMTIIKKLLGSGFFSGYIPFIPGTMGSLAALLIYLIPGFENPTIMLVSISFAFAIGIPIGDYFEKLYGKDPKQFTLDEIIGTWISLLFIPKIPLYYLSVFILWRVLDIIKPFPAGQLEKISGGWGIIADDVVAGIYCLIIVHIFISFII